MVHYDLTPKTYQKSLVAAFSKTKERFGGLSNMAANFPLRVNGVKILTAEALYQACRFPLYPDIQKQIIAEPSPMSAKMKSKRHRHLTRPDWEQVKVEIMWWCLQLKLIQNPVTFGPLLNSTGDLPIVEVSHKDRFWGAVGKGETLEGANVLGQLLQVRRDLNRSESIPSRSLQPSSIPDFLLYGDLIGSLCT